MKKEQRRAEKAAKRAARDALRRSKLADIPIFWAEPTGRKFITGTWKCPNGHYQTHDTEAFEVPKEPIPCDQCELQAEGWSGSTDTEFVRPDTGQTYRSALKLPPGACYEHPKIDGSYHNWVSNKKGNRLQHRPGPDGRVLNVMLPDGHPWTNDSRCNNCTMPDDDKHWCWVREGRPEDGTLNVTKGRPGQSCQAGAGSIATSRYHGFLRNGRLVAC